MSDAVNHPFNKLMLRCERASKQVKEYEALWVSLREAYPSEIAPKLNPKTGHTDFYVTQLTPIDPELSAIAGEVFHNLRAALDNLAWNLVLSNGGSPGRHTGFPVFDTFAEYSDPRYGAGSKDKRNAPARD